MDGEDRCQALGAPDLCHATQGIEDRFLPRGRGQAARRRITYQQVEGRANHQRDNCGDKICRAPTIAALAAASGVVASIRPT